MTSKYSEPYNTGWAEWVVYTATRVLNGDRDISDLDQSVTNLKAYLAHAS